MRATPRDVLVLRALHLGDLLRAVPTFRAMRVAWPEATIRLIGLPWSRALVPRLPGYLDGVVDFPGWPGVPQRAFEPARTSAFLDRARSAPADLAIQLHGSGRHTNRFVAPPRGPPHSRHVRGAVGWWLLGFARLRSRLADTERAPSPNDPDAATRAAVAG